MSLKPEFYGPEFASAFEEASVVQAYQHRPAYPDEVFDVLDSLIIEQPRTILDAGCGTGFLARSFVTRVERVDALDSSSKMIEQGQHLPGGKHPGLCWIVGRVEDVKFDVPYALIVAGDSLHWFDWSVVMPRFASMLTPHGYLASLTVGSVAPPWQEGLRYIIPRYSTNKQYRDMNVYDLLEHHGLFRRVGIHQTAPVSWTQSLEDYIESFHGRASFSRERMTQADAAAFDAEVRALVEPFSHNGCVHLEIRAEIVWGKPLKGAL